jgi:hypothetical protein
MKKRSVVEILRRNEKGDYDGKNGKNYCYVVKFENGDTGEYHCLNPDKPRFKLNEEADYEITPIMSKRNPNEVWKYKVSYVSDFKPGGGGGKQLYKMPEEQQKSIAMQVAIEVAIDFAIARKEESFEIATQKCYDWLTEKELVSDTQRQACGCLRQAVHVMKIPKFSGISIDTLLNLATQIFEKTSPNKFL